MDELLAELEVLIRARYAFLYLVSWEERRLLRAFKSLASRISRPLIVWSPVTGFSTADGHTLDDAATDPVAALQFVADYRGEAIFFLPDFHPYLDDHRVVRHARELAPRCGPQGKAVLFVSPVLRLNRELEKEVSVHEVPLPNLTEVTRLLSILVRSQRIELEPALFERFVKASLGLTEDEIKKVYSRVLQSGLRFSEEDLALVISEKRKLLQRNRFLEFLPPSLDLKDVGGLGQLKQWLVERQTAFTERARRFGLPQPKGLFLLGVQGCGKSLTAKAVAGLWKVPLLRLDMGALVSSAEVEGGLRDTIRIAESMSPAVLWVDEIEKAFAGMKGGRAEPGVVRVFGAFISWLQEKDKPVFVISTANDVTQLPPELLRKGRFDELFFVDLPNVHEREQIFKIHLERRGRQADEFRLWELAEASEKFSGAEIEQLIIDAMFTAFGASRELQQRDIQRSLRDAVPLARTMEEAIKSLREWARLRCRPATYDTRRIDFFEDWDNDDDGDEIEAARELHV